MLEKSNDKYNPQVLMKLGKQTGRWLHCYKEGTVKIKLHLLSFNIKYTVRYILNSIYFILLITKNKINTKCQKGRYQTSLLVFYQRKNFVYYSLPALHSRTQTDVLGSRSNLCTSKTTVTFCYHCSNGRNRY